MTMSTVTCVHYGGFCDEATDSITSSERWENLKKKALLWSCLDKFGDVHATVDWDKGPIGQRVHDACRLNLCNTKKLEQANKRHKNRVFDECLSQSSSTSNAYSRAAAPAAKKVRTSQGLIYDNTKSKRCQDEAHGMWPNTETTQNQDAEYQITKVPATGPRNIQRQRQGSRTECQEWQEMLCREAECAAGRGEQSTVYKITKHRYDNYTNYSGPAKGKDGSTTTTEKE